jgi:hypothetical protein
MKRTLLFFALFGSLALFTTSCNQSNNSKEMLEKVATAQLNAHLQDMVSNPVTRMFIEMGTPPTYSANPVTRGNAFSRSILQMHETHDTAGYQYTYVISMGDTAWIGLRTFMTDPSEKHVFTLVHATADMEFSETKELTKDQAVFVRAFCKSWDKGEQYEVKDKASCGCPKDDQTPQPSETEKKDIKQI